MPVPEEVAPNPFLLFVMLFIQSFRLVSDEVEVVESHARLRSSAMALSGFHTRLIPEKSTLTFDCVIVTDFASGKIYG
ncbi:hypothetical protein H6768_02730 [Candidatus Peribacteria bacterium]|nr:hypothetical protein [Candidatus Peribacteria bacterium]